MTPERKLSGIVAIQPYDDPVVLEQQLRLQEHYDNRPEMVEPMRRKLARLKLSHKDNPCGA